MSCWISQGGTIGTIAWNRCPDSPNCCAAGDECLPNHMCWSDRNNTNKIDYYPAACATNNVGKISDCPNWCGEESAPALVQFNDNNNTWTCCSKGNLGQPSCGTGNLGESFSGPLTLDQYENITNISDKIDHLSTGAIIGIVAGGIVLLSLMAFFLFRCCCSRRARDRRARGKFAPLGAGRDLAGDQVVWNSNVHDGHELHDGPMGGYARPPPGVGMPGGPPPYTVQSFR